MEVQFKTKTAKDAVDAVAHMLELYGTQLSALSLAIRNEDDTERAVALVRAAEAAVDTYGRKMRNMVACMRNWGKAEQPPAPASPKTAAAKTRRGK